MGRYRKLPVEIDAFLFGGSDTDWNALSAFFGSKSGSGQWMSVGGELVIFTLEGDMRANAGDWIIKGVNGEFYPCKPDIFAKTYEAVA
jgi:hypothetical protein